MIEIRSVRDVLRLLFIFRRDFLWAFVATALILLIGAFALPTRYASEARLLVKPGRENLSVPIDAPDRQTVVPQSTQRDPIVDEEKMLTGRSVVDEVTTQYLRQLGPDVRPHGFFGTIKYQVKKATATVVEGSRNLAVLLGLSERIDDRERLARRLLERFDVSHTPGSAVMEIRFAWDDAAVAQRVLDIWLHAYMDERARVLGRGSLVAFYEGKSEQATQQVDAYKKTLQTRLQEIDGISATERLESITERLNVVRARQADAIGELAGLKSGIGASTARIAQLPAEVLQDREVGPDTAWLALSAQLAELKRQRVEALRTFNETAPPVRAIDESIALLQARQQSETRDAPRLERRTANTVTTKLQNDSVTKSVRLAELNALVGTYDAERSALETERQRVMSAEPELAQMERALAAAEKNSSLYLDNLEKARIDQALDESRISNVATVQPPTFDPARVFPKSLTLLMMALPAGIVVGLLTVYLRSMLDQRIHDGSRVETRFGVKLWSTVKAIHVPADEDSSFDASIFRLFSRLPMDRLAEQGLTLGLTSARTGEGVRFLGQRLHALASSEKVTVLLDPPQATAAPGQLVLSMAPGLLESREALSKLRTADLIVLVVEARASTVPMVEHALDTLRSAFGKVDGIIVNRREFEVPRKVLRWLGA